MSSKLVVEFCDGYSCTEPVAAVLVFHGGEEPEAAAWTLTEFLIQMRSLSDIGTLDAYALATRFILWQQSLASNNPIPKRLDAVLVKVAHSYRSQLARIHVGELGPSVTIVHDEFTTSEEMERAELILEASRIMRTPSYAK